jgi:tetratricopeptide (TPR) repeat protein
MPSRWIVGALALLAAIGPAQAEVPAGECPRWTNAEAVMTAAQTDAQANGLRAVANHVEALEQALADRDKPCPDAADATVTVLTDGVMEALVVTASAAKTHPDKKVVTVQSPYPMLALLLGSYYVETRRYEEAVRVFDRERAADPGNTGEHRPGLITERAVALGQLHRLDEALAAYDEGLTLAGLSNKDRARMDRGRGFILTEVERIDEAEAAYRESLKFDPGNPLALNEIEYIHRLRQGAGRAPVTPTLPTSPP